MIGWIIASITGGMIIGWTFCSLMTVAKVADLEMEICNIKQRSKKKESE